MSRKKEQSMKFTLAQANREAKACGMTYGKWEALRQDGNFAAMRGFGMTLEQIARATGDPKHIEMARAAGIEVPEPKQQKARRGRRNPQPDADLLSGDGERSKA